MTPPDREICGNALRTETACHEGFIPVEGGRIFYKVCGNPGKTPILALHGGPGFSHDLLLDLKELSNDRQVIFYDQLGSGKSDRPKDLSLWTIDRFVRELEQVRAALHLDKVILWGVSWGTMVTADYLLTHPVGVEAAIFSSPCLSAKMWKNDADRLRLSLPKNVQDTLIKHEAIGTTESEEYQGAMWEYLKRYACRLDPVPKSITDAFEQANMEVYKHMWGPSEFCPTGNLKNYDRTPDLGKFTVPSFFVCGQFDEATPESTAEYARLAHAVDFEVMEGCSHTALNEQPEQYLKIMRRFLEKVN